MLVSRPRTCSSLLSVFANHHSCFLSRCPPTQPPLVSNIKPMRLDELPCALPVLHDPMIGAVANLRPPPFSLGPLKPGASSSASSHELIPEYPDGLSLLYYSTHTQRLILMPKDGSCTSYLQARYYSDGLLSSRLPSPNYSAYPLHLHLSILSLATCFTSQTTAEIIIIYICVGPRLFCGWPGAITSHPHQQVLVFGVYYS